MRQQQQPSPAQAVDTDIEALLAALEDDAAAATSPVKQQAAASKKKKKETAAQREAKKQQKLRLQRLQEQQQKQRSAGSSRSGSEADDGNGQAVVRQLAAAGATSTEADAGAAETLAGAHAAAEAGSKTEDATAELQAHDTAAVRVWGHVAAAGVEAEEVAAAGMQAAGGSGEQSTWQQGLVGTSPVHQSPLGFDGSLYGADVWQETAQAKQDDGKQGRAGTAKQRRAAGSGHAVQSLAVPQQLVQQPQSAVAQQQQEMPILPHAMLEALAAAAASRATATSPPAGILRAARPAPAGSSPSSGQKGPKLCMLCGERRSNMLLMPCKHMVLCDACADVDSCPSCGQQCKQRVKVHQP
jgi:hypothetical protein